MTSVVAMPTVTPVEGKPNLLLGAYDIAAVGYTAGEYFVSGTARAYGEGPQPEVDYTTRIVALLPADTAKFNGTVLVEWLNVSGGIDAPAVWFMAHREMIREGYAYIGVSAQKVGVDGGLTITGFDMSLKTQDPQRYSRLNHPGDAYSFDMFSQVGQLVRASPEQVLGRLSPEFVIAIGESQSAMFLTTYINAVDQHARVFDGFLVHSRFGGAASLDGINTLEAFERGTPDPSPFRDDLRVPTMNVITETDVVGAILPGYYMARQQDNDMLRTWEIAGTAHADAYTVKVGFIDDGSLPVEQLAAGYAPSTELMGQQLKQPFNFGPQHHYVLQAAISRLHAWVAAGEAPPHAPRLETDDDQPPAFVVDEHGIAKGGVRTPWVEVPIARTSGTGDDATPVALLFGSGEPFDEQTRKRLYPGGRNEYIQGFTEELDATIRAGYLLRADRSEILELAAATY